MWDFSFRRSIGMMVQTMPFVLLRIAVYFGVALAYLLITGTGRRDRPGVSGALGDEGFRASSTLFGGLTGFGIVAIVMYWLREYILYLVKARAYRGDGRAHRQPAHARGSQPDRPCPGHGARAFRPGQRPVRRRSNW